LLFIFLLLKTIGYRCGAARGDFIARHDVAAGVDRKTAADTADVKTGFVCIAHLCCFFRSIHAVPGLGSAERARRCYVKAGQG
jgi:hypothetical protein